MNADEYKLWQDVMGEILVLKNFVVDIEKRLNLLYDKVDEKLDKKGDKDEND